MNTTHRKSCVGISFIYVDRQPTLNRNETFHLHAKLMLNTLRLSNFDQLLKNYKSFKVG